jgi:hypothetical protein
MEEESIKRRDSAIVDRNNKMDYIITKYSDSTID